jgi:AcrR family transcriptional regulator
MAKSSGQQIEKRKRGRPRRDSAVKHDRMLDAVMELLKKESIRDLTVDTVSRAGRVSKPTLYKWWPSRSGMIMDMFVERMVSRLPEMRLFTAEQIIRIVVPELVEAFNGHFGRVVAQIIGEGQSDPNLLRDFKDRYLTQQRDIFVQSLKDAFKFGQLNRPMDPEFLADLILGPMIFRLLIGHQPLDKKFAQELVDLVLKTVS